MTLLRCSAKLLKRMRQPANPPEPPPANNPLGEWCADVEFIDRHPFVLLMNAATGMILVLPATAADLRRLHVMASEQMAALFRVARLDSPIAQAEVDALTHPFAITSNSNRSLVTSLNLRKFEAWLHIAEGGDTAFEVARRMLEVPFSRKDLPKGFHFAIDLLRRHLQPTAKILHFPTSTHRH